MKTPLISTEIREAAALSPELQKWIGRFDQEPELTPFLTQWPAFDELDFADSVMDSMKKKMRRNKK